MTIWLVCRAMRVSATGNASAAAVQTRKTVDIAKRSVHRLRGREISANQFDLARQRGAIRISCQGADVRIAVKKLRNHLTADGSRCTGDEDSFHDPMVSVRPARPGADGIEPL